MRVINVFVLFAVALVVTSECASATSLSSNARILRSDKKEAAATAAGEERDMEAQILDKMLNDHAYAKQTFRNWLQNGQDKEDIETLLKDEGLLDKYSTVVNQYGQYLEILKFK